MVLNYVFIAFFVIAFVVALVSLLFTSSFDVFNNIVDAAFQSAKTGFEISLFLTGVLALWLGLMRIAEDSKLIEKLAKISAPVLKALFPNIDTNSPVMGNIMMNISANMLGLDNAATPIGLKAMQGLQEINKDKSKASDEMIMFTALNASGLTIVPTSIIAYRMQGGASNPADVFIPILLATTISTIFTIIMVGAKQRINLFSRHLLIFILSLIAIIVGIVIASFSVDSESFSNISRGLSSVILISIMLSFIIYGSVKKINVYESFVNGAKEAFPIAISIVPYLIAILLAVAVFRASGAMNFISDGISYLLSFVGIDTSFVGALPTMLMKPLSGSGARGLMVDAMNTFGADSFVGRLASTVQGASDTTFYIIAVYFGAVKISNTRYTLSYSLLADLVGMISAIFFTYLFFPH